ncbi:MAG: beta strand repeat-containing protein, partial [Gaiellaceae bacterium]
PGGLYRYVGAPGTVDLGATTYSDTSLWTPVAVGDVALTAGESATIHATAQADAIAASFSLAGLSFAGAGANAQNVILTDVGAHVVSASLASGGNVAVQSSNSGGITAHVTSAAAALAAAGFASVGAAIGTSISRNFIGFDPQGTPVTATHTSDARVILTHGDTVRVVSGVRAGDVYTYVGATTTSAVDLSNEDYGNTANWQLAGTATGGALSDAYLKDASLVTAGELRVSSDSAQSITATIEAISVAVAVGLFSDAGAGAGVDVVNSIGAGSSASISGSRGAGVTAGDVVITAEDTSGISATANAASVAVQIGFSGGAVSVGIADARNDISNAVQASVDGATLTTTSGGATIEAFETVTQNSASSTAAAVAASLSEDGSLSVAGADADSITETSTSAGVSSSTLSIAGALTVHADADASSTTARVHTTSASVGFVAFAFTAEPETTAESSPTVNAYLSSSDVTAGGNIGLTATAETGATATTDGSSFTVGITGSSDVGVTATAEVTPAISAYVSGSGSSTTSTGGAITIRALHDLDPTSLATSGGTASATANASGIAVSIAPGSASTTATATETPTVAGYAGGTLTAHTTVTIEAESSNTASASGDGNGGGFVGIGASHATATTNGTTAAHLDGSVATGTANLDITTVSTDLATATSDASGKGVVGILDNTAHANATPTADAYFGTGASASVSGNIEVSSTEQPEA